MSRHRSRSRVWGPAGAGLGAVAVAAVLWMAPAFACTVQSHVAASPGRGAPGAVVRIDGSGFDPSGGSVSVDWVGQNGLVPLATVPASNGGFAVDVTIPANAAWGGQYGIRGSQVNTSPPHEGVALFRTSRLPPPPPVQASPAGAPAAPAPVPVPAPVPAPAPAAHAGPAPGPAPGAQVQASPAPPPPPPPSAPADASGFSRDGAPAFTPSGQAIAPLESRKPNAFGGRVPSAAGQSPWLLVPLGLTGLTLFAIAAAAALRQTLREGARATI